MPAVYDPADMTVPELRQDDLDRKPPWYRQCYEGYVANGRQPDEPTLRRYIASAYDQLRFVDHQFGRLLAALDQAGVADNTLVLLTADHGLSLNDHWQWRHGPFLFDQVINIPQIWRLPSVSGQTGVAGLQVALTDPGGRKWGLSLFRRAAQPCRSSRWTSCPRSSTSAV